MLTQHAPFHSRVVPAAGVRGWQLHRSRSPLLREATQKAANNGSRPCTIERTGRRDSHALIGGVSPPQGSHSEVSSEHATGAMPVPILVNIVTPPKKPYATTRGPSSTVLVHVKKFQSKKCESRLATCLSRPSAGHIS